MGCKQLAGFFRRAGTSRASPGAQAAQPRHVLKGSLQVTVKILSGRRANFKNKSIFPYILQFLFFQNPQALIFFQTAHKQQEISVSQ